MTLIGIRWGQNVILPVAAPSIRGGCTWFFGLVRPTGTTQPNFSASQYPFVKGEIIIWLVFDDFFGFTWFWYPHGAALLVAERSEVAAAADLLALATVLPTERERLLFKLLSNFGLCTVDWALTGLTAVPCCYVADACNQNSTKTNSGPTRKSEIIKLGPPPFRK